MVYTDWYKQNDFCYLVLLFVVHRYFKKFPHFFVCRVLVLDC